jgi:hypothetical protein
VLLFSCGAAFASDIRDFNLPALDRLGNELPHRDEIARHAADLAKDYPGGQFTGA